MIVKKFQAATQEEAILKANEELGPQAVVLNVKTMKQRGIFKLFKKDVVEITAALEETDFVSGINKKKPTMASSTANVTSSKTNLNDNSNDDSKKALQDKNDKTKNVTGKPASKIDLVADDNIDSLTQKGDTSAIEAKLDSLHSLLKNQIEGASVKKEDDAVASKDEEKDEIEDEGKKVVKERENANYKFLKLIYKKLVDNEVDPKIADDIIGDIEKSLKKESNIDSILAAIYQKIILKLGEPKTIEAGEKPKVIFFIGPTGVGKTTTIAKIASKFKLEKDLRVAFITSDTYRIAAVEQLNTYASIIDCPVSVVYEPDEMDECLEEYKNYDLIFVDTAGRSHKAEDQMDELSKLIEKMESHKEEYDCEIYLTLSVTTKYRDLVNITEKYKDIKDWTIIFTKLDETCSLGNILNIKLMTGAQLSYTTSGQTVPDDIEVINEQRLAKQILGGNS